MAEGHASGTGSLAQLITQKLKIEDDSMSEENHSHKFILKYFNSEKTYTIHYDRHQTVLESIKLKVDVLQELKCEEQSLTVQIRRNGVDTAIATHFPCVCLQDGELVTLAAKKKSKEDKEVIYNKLYYVLFIKTEGGLNAKSKSLFRKPSIKKFTQVCVYGTKGMNIRDAIALDGRFTELENFKLEDVSKDKSYVFSDDKIEAHENKTFRICFERKPRVSTKLEKQSTEQKSAEKGEAQDASGQIQGTAKIPPRPQDTEKIIPKSENVQPLPQQFPDLKKIPKSENVQPLPQQFPDLKKIMENRFPEDTLEETLQKVDFGKAQQSFSDVFRLESLLKQGKSVGKLVGNAFEGTAFVLCDRYIITNAHTFNGVVIDNNLDPNVEVSILFNYINPNQEGTSRFIAHKMIDFDREQDYAVLELEVSDQDKVPPGLMNRFCPMPENGEACIIGHPRGHIKKIDPTCIIENTSRSQEVHKHLERFKDNMIAHMSVSQLITNQGISRILSPDNNLYYDMSSYHTFMDYGSSGSPVFDAQCRVFGLHSGGFVYGLRPKQESVIEFSRPLLLIFEKFVTSLNNRNQHEVLSIVKEHSKQNLYLKEILRKILGSENMDTN